MSDAFAFAAPLVSALVLAALVPLATARVLAAVLLRGAPPGGEERARRVLPFRIAAHVVGFVQIQLAWMIGARAFGAASTGAMAFGGLAAAIAFLAGGVGRRVEDPPGDRSSLLGALMLRARFLPWLAGTAAVAVASTVVPLVGPGGSVQWAWVLVVLALCAIGVAYGGFLASVAVRAIVPAGAAVKALARDVAARERTSLHFVLRLPTHGARFANAAAIPWARAVIVTDRIVELLTPDELRAVLAHEAGHLSEPPRVLAARLGSATLLLFALTSGTRIAEAYGASPIVVAVCAGALALATLLGVRRIARGMEERADAHARETVGAAPLAEALRKLHADGQLPLVTGARRVHPDLYDRLRALGVDPGPKPPAPDRRRGLVVGLVLSGILVLAGLQILTSLGA